MSRSLDLVTFNVFFGEHHRDARQEALLGLLEELDPDVIGLQEATPELVERIERAAWLEAYTRSDPEVHPHGLLCLSRVPVRRFVRHPLRSMFGRELLIAELEDLAIGIVHLESTRGLSAQRRAQLASIFPRLAVYTDAVLMGDLNLCSSWDENGALDPAYVDVWPAIHPEHPGWTEDTDINLMRKELRGGHKQVRFDRVLLRSASWRATEIELVGTRPVASTSPLVFPSDHFGLRARLIPSRLR